MTINEVHGVPVAILENVETKVSHLKLRNSAGMTADYLRRMTEVFNRSLKSVIQKQIAKLIPKMYERELNNRLRIITNDYKIPSNHFPFTMRTRLASSPVVTEKSLKILLSFNVGKCDF